jgi:hypothetical protein
MLEDVPCQHPMTWAQFVQQFDASCRSSFKLCLEGLAKHFPICRARVALPTRYASMSREMKVDAGSPAFEAMNVA